MHSLHRITRRAPGARFLSLCFLAIAACSDEPPSPTAVPTGAQLARGGNGDNNGRILFVSDRDEPAYFDIYSMNPDGTGVTRPTGVPANVHDLTPVWSPDGKKAAFASS